MRLFFTIFEDPQVKQILDDTYDEMFAAVKHKRPQAAQLIDDEELSQLHDLLALIRLGHIKVKRMEKDFNTIIVYEIQY